MRIKTRVGVFESNSSSTHSLSFSRNHDFCYTALDGFIEDGILKVSPGEFGWEEREYHNAYNKLQYVIVMTKETELPYKDKEDVNALYKTEGFKAVKELLTQIISNCEDIEVIPDNEDYYSLGYIDHQSYEDYSSLEDFLNQNNTTLENFIFDRNIGLHTDNDNH